MPEGPEIRLAADKVARAIAGKPLVKIYFGLPRLRHMQRRLTGTIVTRVDTRGKAMLTRFDNGLSLYSHNQLYGRWYVTNGQLPDTGRSLRVALYAADSAAFLYSASDVEVLDDNAVAEHPFLRRLGPDILSTTPAEVARVLSAERFAGRALGGLYLDQGFLAGIGNYLRSEILHFAGLHYKRKPRELTSRERHRLATTTCTIAERSYRTRGVTNPATLARRLKREGLAYGKYRFAVFGRADQPCYRCNATVARVSVASRRLYFCPGCTDTPLPVRAKTGGP